MNFRNCLTALVMTIIGLAPVSSDRADAGCGAGGCGVNYGYSSGCGSGGCSVNYGYNNNCAGGTCGVSYSTSYYPGQWVFDNQYGWVKVVSVGQSSVPAAKPAKAKAPTSVANGKDDKPVAVTVDDEKPAPVKKPKAPTNRDD